MPFAMTKKSREPIWYNPIEKFILQEFGKLSYDEYSPAQACCVDMFSL